MRNLFLFCLIFFSLFVFSQQNGIYLYPTNQEAYSGGKEKLYSHLHKNLIEHHFEKCADTLQNFKLAIIVKKDASISLIKNTDDSLKIVQNKCAYDLAKKVLPYLTNWKPSIYQNQKTAAIYEFDFIPNDLFENYEEGYIGVALQKNQVHFPGGIDQFRNIFTKELKIPSSDFNGLIKSDISFNVNSEGEIFDVKVISNPYNSQFEKNIISALKKIKTKWVVPKNYDLSKKPFIVTMPLNLKSE